MVLAVALAAWWYERTSAVQEVNWDMIDVEYVTDDEAYT
jgi:hypothetical protein